VNDEEVTRHKEEQLKSVDPETVKKRDQPEDMEDDGEEVEEDPADKVDKP